jgi:hypothetical protein
MWYSGTPAGVPLYPFHRKRKVSVQKNHPCFHKWNHKTKAKEKQMDGVMIQNAMLEMQSMIETMQAYPQTPLEQLFKVEKIDTNTYQKENIKIVIWEDQVKHGVISIFNQDDVICETPFVLGGTSHG